MRLFEKLFLKEIEQIMNKPATAIGKLSPKISAFLNIWMEFPIKNIGV